MKIDTPLGPAWATVKNGALTGFGFGDAPETGGADECVARQIAEYFGGTRHSFDLTLAPSGSEFQKKVWRELMRIPFGETITYAELARRVGKPRAARAVGRANATNRIALVIPCHRVIGSNGKLTGYAFGVEIKEKLLEWERSCLTKRHPAAA